MLKATVVVLALVGLVAGGGFITTLPLEQKPNLLKCVPGCYVAEIEDIIPVGETRRSEKLCAEYTCQEDSLQIAGCKLVPAIEGCQLVFNNTKPYPRCCDPDVICD